MKLIEADKVKRAMKDYWKAQVDKALTLTFTDGNEANKRINSYLEHSHELLKAIDEMPSAEPKAISEWKKEFREYVDSLDIARDDWKGIIEYIDELPSAEPNTTTHDSIPAKTGKNDGDKTSGDCISRQAVTKFLNDWLSCLFENCHKQSASDLKMIIKDFKNLPSAQPELKELSEWKADFKGYINALNMPKDDYDGIMEYIDEVPSVQPERIKGHWIEIASSNHTYKCSVCGRLLTNITDGKNKVAKNYPYCHCGADMRGEQDG